MAQAKIRVEEAVGMVLAHDITEIRRGEFKGPAFRKGHRLEEADICHLQRLGKRHLYVLKIDEGFIHENDAAVALVEAFCGDGVTWKDPPKEGKIALIAARDGLFKVDVKALTEINLMGDMMCASRHTNFLVKKGATVAATRAIPLVIRSELVARAARISQACGGLFQVKPLKKAKVGIVITGNEVFTRLIEDQFEPVLRRKVDQAGSEVIGVSFAPDEPDVIEQEIRALLNMGADLLLVTGGMSVDPDDVTRQGVTQAGAKDFIYGAPVLPGAMFMISAIGDVPVLGIPACGLYHEATIFDLVLPRILAGEQLTREEIAAMGHGGLCLHCPECRYPVCPFGKGA
jgi:molybdenum cofactor synthesis domain-containing protein